MKKNFWPFFLVLSNMESSWNSSEGPTRCFDHDCSNDKNISLTPKRSTETNISKKIFFLGDKCFWPTFPCIIACGKHQGTFYKGPQIFLTFTLELIRACFFDLNGCWKHKVLKTKAFFPVKETFWPSFSHFIERGKVMEHNIRVQKVFWLKFCKWGDQFFGT